MNIEFYMDENIDAKIVRGLRLRGITLITAQEDGMRQKPDAEVLNRATSLGYISVSEDEDFLIEAVKRQETGQHFSGVIRVPQGLPVGIAVEQLELIAKATELGEYANRIEYLPL